MKFTDLTTIDYQGQVIAFTRNKEDLQIQFNILDLNIDSQNDELDWSGFNPVNFPKEVRPVGMNIINVSSEYDNGVKNPKLQDSGQPFKVLTNQKYIYILRSTVGGALLVNRFRLTRKSSPVEPEAVVFDLVPAWEVRFERSKKPDTPADKKDNQNYFSPEKKPFIEPTLLLEFDHTVQQGNFECQLLPISETSLFNLILVLDAKTTSTLDFYTIPLNEEGLFDLSKMVGQLTGNKLTPEYRVQLLSEEKKIIPWEYDLSGTFYLKQERYVDDENNAVFIKRNGRYMLSAAVIIENAEPTLNYKTVANIDFGISDKGTLAVPETSSLDPNLKQIILKPVNPSNYAIEFDDAAHVKLPNHGEVLSLKGNYAMACQIFPYSLDISNQVIIGSSSRQAPYIHLVEGRKLEFGFMGANEKPLAYITDEIIVQHAWNEIQLIFDQESPSKFVLKLNNENIPFSAIPNKKEGDKPNGSPVDLISSPSIGFIGQMDNVNIWNSNVTNNETLVGSWNFNSINYSSIPATTPDSTGNNNGVVQGAKLAVSTSPINNSELTGNFYLDESGLSIQSYYLKDFKNYGEIDSSPCLLASADGLLHCYFRGKENLFSVMQLNTEAARAIYDAEWKDQENNTGKLQFFASRNGTNMNNAAIKVKNATTGSVANFCDVSISRNPSVPNLINVVEDWKGVPSDLASFEQVINGESVDDPSDPRIKTTEKVFFDKRGIYSSAYLATEQSSNESYLGFVSRFPTEIYLAEISTGELANNELETTIKFEVPKWGDEFRFSQTWQKLNNTAVKYIDILNGVSSSYNYSDQQSEILSYTINADAELVSSNPVIFFMKTTGNTMLKNEIVDSSLDSVLFCNVSMEVKNGEESLKASWKNVSRQQNIFKSILNHSNQSYDYNKLATEDFEAIAQLFVIIENGNDAYVRNTKVVPKEDNVLASATLFELFATQHLSGTELVPACKTETAEIFQSARSTTINPVGDQSETVVIEGASQLFSARAATTPTTGSISRVQPTSNLTDATANLVKQGAEGGWINEAPQKTLEFDYSSFEESGENKENVNYVSVSTEQSNINKLALQGDMSLEMWCQPMKSRRDSFKANQRLLTFNTEASQDDFHENAQYLAGLKDAPSAKFIKENKTRFRRGYTLESGTFSYWFSPNEVGDEKKPGSGIIAGFKTLGIERRLFTTQLKDQKLSLFFLDDENQKIQSEEVIDANQWYQVVQSFSYKKTEEVINHQKMYKYEMKVSLYLNGVLQGNTTFESTISTSNPYSFATAQIGDETDGLDMLCNECAVFNHVLSKNTIEKYYNGRVPSNAEGLVLKYMLLEGDGNVAVNTAPTGSEYNADILPEGSWSPYGLYFYPDFAFSENAAILIDQPIIRGWSHLAMVHQAGYALTLDGSKFANCGNNESLEMADEFALEAWINIAKQDDGIQRSIITKGKDYSLYLDNGLVPCFSVNTSEGKLIIKAENKIDRERTYYLTSNYKTVQVDVDDPNDPEKQKKIPKFEIHMEIYLDAVRVATSKKEDGTYVQYNDPVEIENSSINLNLGRNAEDYGKQYLTGRISDARIWGRILRKSEIDHVLRTHRLPQNKDGLISYWRFNDFDSKIAFDAQQLNNAILSANDIQVYNVETAINSFYVNGIQSNNIIYPDNSNSLGGYGDKNKFTMAFRTPSEFDPKIGYSGKLDDVRIWDTILTQEQISDNMYKPLVGSEDHLVGLWSFNNGSGNVVEDLTGNGNRGTLVEGIKSAPLWQNSKAPISNESKEVYNILGGVRHPGNAFTTEVPTVIEYADIQRDAYGDIFSVMKRAYLYIKDENVEFVTGYKVDDLDTIYLGQAQSKPKLLGYIEGAPPIPSENQTMPFWAGDIGEYHGYGEATTVQFNQASETSYVYNSEKDDGSDSSTDWKFGLALASSFGTAFGLIAEVDFDVFSYELRAGGGGGSQSGGSDNSGLSMKQGTSKTIDNALTPGGYWEDKDQLVNKTVGRRYIPSNTGFALVKSLTVDVYASKLKTNGSLVKLSYVPNKDIPEDVNIIDFPIDPKYIKNGTLDGKIGLENDPDYPNADLVRGSYFKPVEAYALKRKIQKEEKQLEAYYVQYNQDRLSEKLGSQSDYDEYKKSVRENDAYNWEEELSRRNIVNTYVWTAGGGVYKEQISPMNVYAESYGAVNTTIDSTGSTISLEAVSPIVGLYGEYDYLYSHNLEINVVKEKESSNAFSLEAEAQPDWFISAPIMNGNELEGYTAEPAEGKVEAYRYMAYYLAPKDNHHNDFFTTVVDKNWLTNSFQSNAVALREATVSKNGAWRVLYRTTFVGRIPPSFQVVPDETQAPNIQEPVNISLNSYIIELVKIQIDTSDPTPLQIGEGIKKVLGSPENNDNGILGTVYAWWPDFLNETKNYQLPASKVFQSLKEDLLQYLIDYFQSLNQS